MTRDEAIDHQRKLAEHFDLGFWYGTRCEKCCGVYPKLETTADGLNCFYRCEVCGKRTEDYAMTWQAKDAWNAHRYYGDGLQLTLF